MTEKNSAIGVLKAFLILAVMIGHNKLLMSTTGLFSVFYSFHIPGFFFVAALLNRNPISKAKIIDKGIAYFYPHIIFFSAISLVFLCSGINGKNPTIPGWFYALISGNGTVAKAYSGFQLLWYLPAIYCFYLVIGFYSAQSNEWVKASLLLVPFTAVLLLFADGFAMDHVPFGVPAVAFIFPVAIVVRWIFDRYGRFTSLYVGALIAVCVLFPDARRGSFNLANVQLFPEGRSAALGGELLFMVAMFFLLSKLAMWLSFSRTLRFIGSHTLEIYLTHHLFDVFLIDWLSVKLRLPSMGVEGFLVGLIILLISLALSLCVANMADKTRLRWLFYPPERVVKFLKFGSH